MDWTLPAASMTNTQICFVSTVAVLKVAVVGWVDDQPAAPAAGTELDSDTNHAAASAGEL